MASIAAAVFSNQFGTVYPDRIAIIAKKSWFGGGNEEEYAVRHVTSVKVLTRRNPVAGVVLLLLGLVVLTIGGMGILFGLLIGAGGILLIMGGRAVCLATAGGERVISVGNAFQKGEAQAYASAVRQVLFA